MNGSLKNQLQWAILVVMLGLAIAGFIFYYPQAATFVRDFLSASIILILILVGAVGAIVVLVGGALGIIPFGSFRSWGYWFLGFILAFFLGHVLGNTIIGTWGERLFK